MKTRILNLSTRNRIILAALSCAGLLYIFTTPVISWMVDMVRPPGDPLNIEFVQSSDRVELNWDSPDDIDITSYIIEINGEEERVGRDTFSYVIENPSYPIEISLRSRDFTGQKSSKTTENYESQVDQGLTSRAEYNLESNVLPQTLLVFRASIIALAMVGLTAYVFQFVFTGNKSYVLLFYPAIVTLPYLLISISFLVSEDAEINKFFISGLFAVGYYLISYFVLLTVNILNISLTNSIPLGQAARASQFIFTLLSSYLVLILFFGSNYSFIEKSILIIGFIFYLSYSSIQMLENTSNYQAFSRASAISLSILMAIFVFSIWPIQYIYAILAISVCYYVLLSISLEVRGKLDNYVWIEYSTLISLISLLLIANSTWGINGTLL